MAYELKVFLDDVRMPPDESWVLCTTAQQCKCLLASGLVTELSLDHDLGTLNDLTNTGYDVLVYLENKVYGNGINPPKVMLVHSDNPVGRKRMLQAITQIEKMRNSIYE